MAKIELDLHGVKHEDVPNTVKRFLEDNWDCGDVAYIITGHSFQMKYLVGLELHRYKMSNWTQDETFIVVHM